MTEFGMPMGPFTLMDMLGIDVCQYVGDYLTASTARAWNRRRSSTSWWRPAGWARRTARASTATATRPTSRCKQMIAAFGRQSDSVFTVERLIYPLINEAVLALQEHIAAVNDIDMAMIAGTGMTYHGERKGPLALADKIGLDVVVEGLEELAQQYGERFRPCNKLYELVKEGRLGEKTKAGFSNTYKTINVHAGTRRREAFRFPKSLARRRKENPMADRQFIRYTIEDRVATLVIDHPPVNAFNTPARSKTSNDAFDELIANPK